MEDNPDNGKEKDQENHIEHSKELEKEDHQEKEKDTEKPANVSPSDDILPSSEDVPSTDKLPSSDGLKEDAKSSSDSEIEESEPAEVNGKEEPSNIDGDSVKVEKGKSKEKKKSKDKKNDKEKEKEKLKSKDSVKEPKDPAAGNEGDEKPRGPFNLLRRNTLSRIKEKFMSSRPNSQVSDGGEVPTSPTTSLHSNVSESVGTNPGTPTIANPPSVDSPVPAKPSPEELYEQAGAEKKDKYPGIPSNRFPVQRGGSMQDVTARNKSATLPTKARHSYYISPEETQGIAKEIHDIGHDAVRNSNKAKSGGESSSPNSSKPINSKSSTSSSFPGAHPVPSKEDEKEKNLKRGFTLSKAFKGKFFGSVREESKSKRVSASIVPTSTSTNTANSPPPGNSGKYGMSSTVSHRPSGNRVPVQSIFRRSGSEAEKINSKVGKNGSRESGKIGKAEKEALEHQLEKLREADADNTKEKARPEDFEKLQATISGKLDDLVDSDSPKLEDKGNVLPPFPQEISLQDPNITPEEKKRRKNIQAKAFVAEELYNTERNYVETLKAIVELFVKPLRESLQTPHPIMSNSDIRVIFSSIEAILTVNSNFLSDLKSLVQTWSIDTRIGTLFKKYFTDCQAYATFVDNYSMAKASLRRNEERSPAYRAFVQDRMNLPESKRQNLGDHFILPIQRVTRYVMLLQDLINHTEPNHVDYEELVSSLELMRALATKINEVKRKEEQFTKMFQIQKEVENCPPTLVKATRKYLLDLNFLEYDPVTLAPVPAARLFLFSDILMIARYSTINWVSKMGSKKNCKFYKTLELTNCSIHLVPDDDEKELKFLFQILHVDKSSQQFCFQAAYAGQRQGFFDAVSEAIAIRKKEESPVLV